MAALNLASEMAAELSLFAAHNVHNYFKTTSNNIVHPESRLSLLLILLTKMSHVSSKTMFNISNQHSNKIFTFDSVVKLVFKEIKQYLE